MQTAGSASSLDPARLEIYRSLLNAITGEMGAALRRSAYSPNIKERRDYSCAICDRAATPVALGDHMPVHLGAMPESVEAAIERYQLEDGDVIALNDPFAGGTHLPDLTLVRPFFVRTGGAPAAYVAARAHHADVGGMQPGSMPQSREIFQEGIRVPPVRLVSRGAPNDDILRLITANVRTPEERLGDLHAQLAALDVGVRRLGELAAQGELEDTFRELVAYADRLVRATIAMIPDGQYRAHDVLDDDGAGSGPVRIVATLSVRDEVLTVDFTGSDSQTEGNVNAVVAIAESAVRYVLRCVAESTLGAALPAGGGALTSVDVIAPLGSVVNAKPPAAVAAGNVETSQRIVDVLLAALAQALPEIVPACSGGTMNNVTIGGIDPEAGEPFAYYETIACGMGASARGHGLAGVHTHMTNSLNTPVEALEHVLPVRVRRYSLRRDSGGAGRFRGGEGVVRELETLAEAHISILSDRREHAPCGASGGSPGAPGENRVRVAGEWRRVTGKSSLILEPGDRLTVLTPGGGGWGSAEL